MNPPSVTRSPKTMSMTSRWMAYSGEPILAEELLFRPTHSIIDQVYTPNFRGIPRTVTASGWSPTPDGSVVGVAAILTNNSRAGHL